MTWPVRHRIDTTGCQDFPVVGMISFVVSIAAKKGADGELDVLIL